MKFVLTEKRMTELLAAEAELAALNMGGVDNWTWHGDSIQMFFDEVKRQTGEEYDDFESYAHGIVEKSERKLRNLYRNAMLLLTKMAAAVWELKKLIFVTVKVRKLIVHFINGSTYVLPNLFFK